MRSSSFLLSLLIHALLILAVSSWSSFLLKREKVRPAEVEIPLELSYLQPPQAPKKEVKPNSSKAQESKKVRAQKELSGGHKVRKRKFKRLKRKRPKPKRPLKRSVPQREIGKKEAKKGVKRKEAPEAPQKSGVEGTFLNKGFTERRQTPLRSPLKEAREGGAPPKPRLRFDPNSYKRLVVAVLEKNKFYPPLARRMGIEGVVDLEITFDRQGKPLEVKVLNSPPRILKRAAVELIKKSKFPPLPSVYSGNTLKLKVDIRYKLE